MTNCELQTTTNDYEFEPKTEQNDYCTNPITLSEDSQRFSWLDDLGWI